MTRQQTLEKLTKHLHALDNEALESVLRLVERIPPEDAANVEAIDIEGLESFRNSLGVQVETSVVLEARQGERY